MAKTGSRLVAEAQARNAQAGGGRLTMNLTPDEMAEWEELVSRERPGKGQQKAALMRAIRTSLASEDPSDEELLAMLARRLARKR